jgi:hypothetical protein
VLDDLWEALCLGDPALNLLFRGRTAHQIPGFVDLKQLRMKVARGTTSQFSAGVHAGSFKQIRKF